MESFPIASYSHGRSKLLKIKLFWVMMHSDIDLYIKEFDHDNAKKGAISCP